MLCFGVFSKGSVRITAAKLLQKENAPLKITHFNHICAIVEKKSAFIGRKFNLFLQKVHFKRKNLNKTEIVKKMRSTAQISSIFAGLRQDT